MTTPAKLTTDERMSVLVHVPANPRMDDETVAAVERILADRLAARDAEHREALANTRAVLEDWETAIARHDESLPTGRHDGETDGTARDRWLVMKTCRTAAAEFRAALLAEPQGDA